MDNNSLLFLEYIKNYGFEPEEYNKILELFQSVNSSISLNLTESDQYLLSRLVDYNELEKVGINGAYGYLDMQGEISVPKCLKNDDEFLHNPVKRPYIKHCYGAPTISDFDVIIGRIPTSLDVETMQQFMSAILYNSKQDQFFGLCIDEDENSKNTVSGLLKIFTGIEGKYTLAHDFKIEYDTISSAGKELLLIKGSK